METGHDEALRETVDRLRLEVDELRASRTRLVLAADADLCRIERDLHDGVQQDLVALAVNLQLARQLLDSDVAAAKTLLEEMGEHVQVALDETAQLAQRIFPPLLEVGLGVALRSAVSRAGIPVSVEVAAPARYPSVVAGTVYLCCLEALERAKRGSRASVAVRELDGELAFDVVTDAELDAGLDRLSNRVEALGGHLTIQAEPGGGTRVSGSLPLPGPE